MSGNSLNRRERLAEWLNKRDTAIIEAFLGFCALIVAWRVVDFYEGKPVAPITGSALFKLSQGFWFWALVVGGILTLVALIYGLWTGNTYRIRSYVALSGAVVWSAVAIAVFTSPAPISVGAGYVLLSVASWVTAIVLAVRADIKSRADAKRTKKWPRYIDDVETTNAGNRL